MIQITVLSAGKSVAKKKATAKIVVKDKNGSKSFEVALSNIKRFDMRTIRDMVKDKLKSEGKITNKISELKNVDSIK